MMVAGFKDQKEVQDSNKARGNLRLKDLQGQYQFKTSDRLF